MIILTHPKKIFNTQNLKNKNIQHIYQYFINFINNHQYECPKCDKHHNDWVVKGYYYRNIFDPSINEVTKLRVKRIKCKHCSKTHALLPDFIIAYSRLTKDIALLILDCFINNKDTRIATITAMDLYKNYPLSVSDSIFKAVNIFKKFHKQILMFNSQIDSFFHFFHLLNCKTNNKNGFSFLSLKPYKHLFFKTPQPNSNFSP